MDEYDAHYDDRWSRIFRERYVHAPLLAGLDLRGRRVLDAMCGSGLSTQALLDRGAQVTGLDVSDSAIESFRRRWPAAEAVCGSITHSGLPSGAFDAVVVVGGLHHLHPHVDDAVTEIHRVLVPGGSFCFMEPHTGSLPDVFRRLWYRRDRLFVDNEAAVDLTALRQHFADRFVAVRETFAGGPAFLLVFNSMVFRIPLRAKGWYSPAVLRLEALLARWQTPRTACFAVCQWRKL
ncbi:MAG TPA: class I SAM-dependent methyltransferase [Candidatus Dormibacteraeota bacterium]|nr:class I SAM-dependent methyltransferase [Candidatus Dormibacteraeota bacterium]